MSKVLEVDARIDEDRSLINGYIRFRFFNTQISNYERIRMRFVHNALNKGYDLVPLWWTLFMGNLETKRHIHPNVITAAT